MVIENKVESKVCQKVTKENIERPANVVKELVENSIDAGATSVSIEIKKGGKGLIKVSDNGKGMSREDMPIALERHATSLVFQSNGDGKIEDIIYKIYGKEIKENIVKVNYEESKIKITGVVGNTKIAKDSRKDQIIFLNKRNMRLQEKKKEK